MKRQTWSIALHRALILLGLLSIPLYLWERSHYAEEKSKFSLALHAADAGRWFWDLRTGEIHWDEQTFRLFGVVGENPINLESFLALIHESDRQRVKESVDRAVANRGGYQDVFRIVLPCGEIREIRAAGMVNITGEYMTGINLPAIHKTGLVPHRGVPLSDAHTSPVPGTYSIDG
jgi:PAS domain-containing protein